MSNRRLPKVGDTVILKGCPNAITYKDKKFKVKRAPFLFNKKIVAQLSGLRGYVPIKNLEIVKYCD
ncbi:hypothetical protein [Clostridium sp. BJN0001]|uniref:hypothetical protein n=1 Tax=Clostridium sp. BJN0001 TaxID=2930219 RepID=UPI001FD5345B|nr:hypothetical protein [Clostridium sp. BJN0001]